MSGPSRVVPSLRSAVLALLAALMVCGCAVKPRVATNDYGVPRCPATAGIDLLSVDALQCWFDGPHGEWRTLSHESHYAVLVVHVQTQSVRDADAIAQRFVGNARDRFSEILVYVQPEPAKVGPLRTRRVRWTAEGGFESIDFDERPAS